MRQGLFPLGVVSSAFAVLFLSGCAASLPHTLPNAQPSTASDTLSALQALQTKSDLGSGDGAASATPDVSAAHLMSASTVEPTASKLPAKAPEPTRTPASVLRLWVAPWEDADGNLHGASHVYTEVLPRRWQLDGANLPAAGVLQPLQLVERVEATTSR